MKNINFKDKKALVRVDFNVPLDNEYNITDDTRIQAALPTIKHILNEGGAAILMSHLGRPQKKLKDDGSIDVKKFTLKHIVNHLSECLGGVRVHFCKDTIGPEAQKAAAALAFGEILVIENTRFQKEESKGDEGFAKELAKLGDVYINDAFGTAHRAHASTTTVAQFFKAEDKSMGYLLEKEITNANKVLNNPDRPLTAIIGGAKVSDKILLLEKLIDFVDNLIVGGGMAYTFMAAQGGKIGGSIVEMDKTDLAIRLMEKAKAKGVKLILPTDNLCADDFSNEANQMVSPSMNIQDGWEGLDIGPDAIEAFKKVVAESKTILWNGPMGVFEFENFAKGTRSIATAVAEATAKG